ncbi:hypothetical protein HaLaN_25452, partial [Haematococcus lacustris]
MAADCPCHCHTEAANACADHAAEVRANAKLGYPFRSMGKLHKIFGAAWLMAALSSFEQLGAEVNSELNKLKDVVVHLA